MKYSDLVYRNSRIEGKKKKLKILSNLIPCFQLKTGKRLFSSSCLRENQGISTNTNFS